MQAFFFAHTSNMVAGYLLRSCVMVARGLLRLETKQTPLKHLATPSENITFFSGASPLQAANE